LIGKREGKVLKLVRQRSDWIFCCRYRMALLFVGIPFSYMLLESSLFYISNLISSTFTTHGYMSASFSSYVYNFLPLFPVSLQFRDG
jgi:hypothetical protein